MVPVVIAIVLSALGLPTIVLVGQNSLLATVAIGMVILVGWLAVARAVHTRLLFWRLRLRLDEEKVVPDRICRFSLFDPAGWVTAGRAFEVYLARRYKHRPGQPRRTSFGGPPPLDVGVHMGVQSPEWRPSSASTISGEFTITEGDTSGWGLVRGSRVVAELLLVLRTGRMRGCIFVLPLVPSRGGHDVS